MFSVFFCYSEICICKYKMNASHVMPRVSASRHKLIHLHLHLFSKPESGYNLLETPEQCSLECKTI